MNTPQRRTRPGQSVTLGRYRLRGVLGQGGMGRLYVAEQEGIEGFAKIVAVKQILPHLADSPEFRNMFLTEARIAARLEHPNIVATHELGEADGTYYIALEYLPGEDLAAILARCREAGFMPVDIAATIAHQASLGLHHAHETRDSGNRLTGLVHRDVNPSNIFLTYYGVVKVLDFGVVKGGTTGATAPGLFKGKYSYCAPEQLESDAIDRRTDVFCVGIVLWECLTGRRLFGGNTDAAIIDAVRKGAIAPPSAFRADVPADLDQLTMRALARRPAERFQSALEMGEALERFQAHRPQKQTANNVGRWLETLFGVQRAVLKRAIGQGRDVERALEHLALMEQFESPSSEPTGTVRSRPGGPRSRTLWSTNLRPPEPEGDPWEAPGPAELPEETADRERLFDDPTSRFDIPPELAEAAGLSQPTPRPRPAPAAPPVRSRPEALDQSSDMKALRIITAIGVLGAAALVAVIVSDGAETIPLSPVPAGATSGSLEVSSDPPGAHVLVDGEPTGLLTPTTLHALRPGRPIEVRLDKPGYRPAIQKIEVEKGKVPRAHSVTLVPAAGTLRIDGLPRGAAVFVDDVPVDVQGPLMVPLGERKLRVEHRGEVLFDQAITARPGEQAIDVTSGARAR
jgi:serine/threonine protein kinase